MKLIYFLIAAACLDGAGILVGILAKNKQFTLDECCNCLAWVCAIFLYYYEGGAQ